MISFLENDSNLFILVSEFLIKSYRSSVLRPPIKLKLKKQCRVFSNVSIQLLWHQTDGERQRGALVTPHSCSSAALCADILTLTKHGWDKSTASALKF